jgi:hypothetical protein
VDVIPGFEFDFSYAFHAFSAGAEPEAHGLFIALFYI